MNPRPSLCQALRETRPYNNSFKVSKKLYEDYIEYRRSRLKAKKSLYWIRKSINVFLNSSNWEISRDILLKIDIVQITGLKLKRNTTATSRTSLNGFTRKRKTTSSVKEVLEPPKRNSKKLNPIIIREEEHHPGNLE